MNDWVTLRTFAFVHEAEMVRGMLENEGIQSVILDENISGLHIALSFAGGGIRLQVRKSEEDMARLLLYNQGLLTDHNVIPKPISDEVEKMNGTIQSSWGVNRPQWNTFFLMLVVLLVLFFFLLY